MKTIFKNMVGKVTAIELLVITLVFGALAFTAFPGAFKSAMAATQNYPPNTPLYVIPIQISGSRTASLSGVAAIKLPYAARLIGFTGIARSYSGVGAGPTVDLRAGVSSVLSAPLQISGVAVTEASIATAAIPDETTLFVDYYLGASGVEATDTTLLMTVVR